MAKGRSGIDFRGLNGVQRLLLNLAPATKRGIQQDTEAVARLIEADAKQRAPVDTGKLRQGITFELSKDGLAASIYTSVPYGWLIEFGSRGEVEIPAGFEDFAAQFKGKGKRTINRPPQPYMIPAWLRYRDAYYEAVSDRIDRLLRL